MEKQELFDEARRFIASGWKCEATAFSIASRLTKARYTDTEVRKEALLLADQVTGFVHGIRMQNKFLNPSVLKPGMELLPVVGWAPVPILDDETGVAHAPAMPQVPEGLDKEAFAHWKKQQADILMGYAEEESETATVPSVSHEGLQPEGAQPEGVQPDAEPAPFSYESPRRKSRRKKSTDNAENPGALLLPEVPEPVVPGTEEPEGTAVQVPE